MLRRISDYVSKKREIIKFWYSRGLNIRLISTITASNLISRGLAGIGIGLLIPIANGVIKNDFSLIQKNSVYKNISKFIPSLEDLSNFELFVLLAGIILILNLIKSIIDYFLDIYQSGKFLDIASNMAGFFFRQQIVLGKAFLDENNSAVYVAKVARLPIRVMGILSSLSSINASLIELMIYSAVLIFISPILFVIALLMIPLSVAPVFFLKKLLRKYAKDEIEGDDNLSLFFYNSIIKTPLIRVYNTEDKEIEDFEIVSKNVRDRRHKMRKFLGIITPVQNILMLISIFVIASLLGFVSSTNTSISVAKLLVFFVTFRQFFAAGTKISNPIISALRAFNGIESILEHYGKNNLVNSGDIVFEKLSKSISIKNLKFGYSPKRMVLKGVNCNILAGKTNAIVGKSGSGKSTIVNLLLRLYDPPKDTIFFDGIDILNFTEKSIRHPFSYVSQDILLFDDTLRNNICYGLKEKPTEEELMDLIKKVNLNYALERMEDGLETNVGDRGILLSGGEKQKIALARALLHESSIIIFDEPTSSIDVETEIEILDLIKKLCVNKTIILIAHNFMTIKDADHVIVVKDGVVKEEGEIKDLIESKNIFYNFWNSQRVE